MRLRCHRSAVLASGLTMLMLVGLSAAQAGRESLPLPTRLTVVRTDSAGAARTWSVTSAHAGAVLSVYEALAALPPTPSGTLQCPNDGFVRYRLQFSRLGRILQVSTADPSGCQFVATSGKVTRWAVADFAPGERFWLALAAALRMRPRDLLWPQRSPRDGRLPAGFKPFSVAFGNRLHGIAVAVRPCAHAVCPALVAQTSDGGLDWQPSLTISQAVTGVGAVRSAFAWVGVPGRIYEFRVDGRETSVATAGLSVLAAAAGAAWGTTGVAPGALGSGLVRLDLSSGSRTAIPYPCRSETLFGLSFPTPTRGWALCAGQPGAGMQEKSVYRTVDGGATWRLISRSHRMAETNVHGPGRNGYAGGIQFLPSGRGWVYGGRGYERASLDGGRSWRDAGIPDLPSVSAVSSVSFPSPADGYALVGSLLRSGAVSLLATFDGGRHWLPAVWW